MKRLLAAAIMLIVIITLCISSNLYVTHACQDTAKAVQNYYEQIFDAENADKNKLSKELEALWHNKKERLELFVNHGFLDEISICISQLPIYAKTGDKNRALIICENIKELCEQIEEEQKFAAHSFY